MTTAAVFTPTTEQARRIVIALQAHGVDAQNAASSALSRAANDAVKAMKRGAPKDQSHLTNAIKAEHVTDLEYRVVVGMGYAQAVEQGRKPGKGLPHVNSPGALGVLGWLRRRQEAHISNFSGPFASAKNKRSTLAKDTDAQLRARYFALSRSIKAKGIKAQPFAGPVVDELRRTLPQRVGDAVAAAVARANTGGPAGTTAGGTAT